MTYELPSTHKSSVLCGRVINLRSCSPDDEALNVLKPVVLIHTKRNQRRIKASQSPVLSFDPLPPTDSINLYNRPGRLRLFENANTFSMFFRSLMPDFNPNRPADELPPPQALQQGEVAAGAEGEGAAVDLRRSVTSLLDAMRDLLSNIHMPDVPADGDIDSDDERPERG